MKMALCCDCVLWLCTIVMLVITNTSAYNCGTIVSNSSGYTIPSGDIVIEYGKPLDIYCVLHDDFVNKNGPNSSSRLSFVRGNTALPSEMIDIINSSTIQLHIEKPPLSNIWHTCVLDGKVAVCGSIVFVGTKPKDVVGFRCISNNYENLTCVWTAPENYVQTTYRLTYHLNGRAGRLHSYDCPRPPKADDKGQMNCFWNLSSTPQYRQAHEQFFFTLTMNNTFGTNSLTTDFNHFQNVLPAPPQHLRVLGNTSSSILLQWKIPRALENFPPGLHHRVLYQCEYGPKEWKLAKVLCVQPEENCERVKKMKFNLTDLPHAHALCDIRVSLRSAKALPDDENMWSGNASITARIGTTVPGAPPKTTIGSFEVVSSTNLDFMGAYVYWQQIPEEIRNGPNFRYNISVFDEPHIRPVEITNSYAKYVNLPVSKSYKFTIWSENSVGPSAKVSEVYIPPKLERPLQPTGFTKIAYGSGKYDLNWQPPKYTSSTIDGYTLFWCNHKRDRPYQCNGFLNWVKIPATATSYTITVPEQDIYHQFAISVNSGESSSGMLWVDCTVIHSKHIGKMKNVQILNTGSTYLDVGWKLECSDQIGSVKSYIVYFCAIGSDPTRSICQGPLGSARFDGDQSLTHGNVTSLVPYTTYMIRVSVVTKDDKESQQSDPIRNTTLEDAPEIPLNVTIESVTNSTMMVTWEPPKVTNGILKYYEIYYNKEKLRINDPKATNYTLTNLTSYVDYNISVVACTVACSIPSKPIKRHTLMGYPGKIGELRINMLNESHIQIKWDKPSNPGGKNDFYELSFKEKSEHGNRTFKLYNVTGTLHTVDYCGVEQKHDRMFISVRAVNVIDSVRYEGPWSEESIAYCSGQRAYWIWFVLPLGMISIVGLLILGKKVYDRYEMMKVVGIVLPQGLGGDVATLKNPEWTQKHSEIDHHPPADEELLLDKIAKTTPPETCDSSITRNDSVTPCAPYVLTGDAPKVQNSGYVPFGDSATESVEKNSGYVVAGNFQQPCDSDRENVPSHTMEHTPYVMTGDVPKVLNPGYVPFTSTTTEPTEKDTGYVVAGNKSMLIPDLLPRGKSIKED